MRLSYTSALTAGAVSTDEAPVSRGAKAVSLLLALLPPVRMAWIVFTYGENNVSNDYANRASLVTSLLDGTCTLGRFVREAKIGHEHSTLALIPIYYLNARLFAWDVRVELALGLLIAGTTLALIAAALPSRVRWALLPLLSLLLFSTTKVSSFTFGESTLQMGLAQLGVAMGAFGFARWGDRPLALAAWMAAGGALASWSWGGGIMAWPVFVAALAVGRVRSIAAWSVLACGAAAGLAQYAWLLRWGKLRASVGPVSWSSKCRLVLDLLGRPFANGIAHADLNPWSQAAGAIGLLFLGAVLIAFRTGLRARPAPLLLAGWTLLVAVQIATFRAVVASWYASPMALFWAALLMLLAAAPTPFRAGGILVIALLTLRVQLTWEDKSFYLPSRAPVSASCLREWRTAPPECHARVFQWGEEGRGNELAVLGDTLERHRLSVFGPRRTYLLQGDVAVGRVTVDTPDHRPFFSRDGVAPADPNDFHRLDLVLAPGASMAWRVDLPPGTRHATFLTVARAAPGDPQLGRGARVSVTAEGSPPVLLDARAFLPRDTAWPLSLDLSSLAGKSLTLHLAGEETQSGATPLIFEAPKIELRTEDLRN